MMQRWRLLPDSELCVFRTTVAFLQGRLSERATLEWALSLGESDLAKRLAVLQVLGRSNDSKLKEPWRAAWRIVEESWVSGLDGSEDSLAKFDIADRIRDGERTGAMIASIVRLVRPFIKVAPFSKLDTSFRRPPLRPKSAHDLMSIGFTSGELVGPKELAIDCIEDGPFLLELTHDLDAAVMKALDAGRRLFGDAEDRMWRFGELHRVYFVQESDRQDDENEPDQFHTGIAPATKLLHAVVARLDAVDGVAAKAVVRRWRDAETPIHIRLWSAFAREPSFASGTEVANFLESLNDRHFWGLHQFPEIAELRARRFPTLMGASQESIARRLRRGPPTRHWPRNSGREVVDEGRRFWAARELRRIQLAGGALSQADDHWLNRQLSEFEELKNVRRIDEGFRGASKMVWVAPDPDARYDLLAGAERLEALEEALRSQRQGWELDPARRASDWIGTGNNAQRLVEDFEAANAEGSFPRVWDRFGSQHGASVQTEAAHRDDAPPSLRSVPERVLALLERLPIETASEAIGGLSLWIDSWAKELKSRPQFVHVWLRLWPLAVAATNAEQPADAEPSLSVVVTTPGQDEPQDLDTLNTPAGRMIGALLTACHDISPGDQPFKDVLLRKMRDAAMSAAGRAGLVVRHRFIAVLPYFLQADPTWTRAALVEPLLEKTPQANLLWCAVARSTRFHAVLKVIGEAMATRAIDSRLDRRTRQSLAFSVVVEQLHAFRSERPPAVPSSMALQMIRSLDDEVRSATAHAVQRFVHDLSVSSSPTGAPDAPETLFRSAAKPFLEKVWPQERSLATPGVSRAFADLPSICRDSFAEAVDAIERFLKPFNCWSLSDYGLYGEVSGEPRLSIINTPEKAEALLRLLDLTIGSAQGAVVPADLGTALAQVDKVVPRIRDSRRYRRLAAVARR